MPPLVPGFIITGEPGPSSIGAQWPAVRCLDGHPFVLQVVPVADGAQAQALADEQMCLHDRIRGEHLVRQHSAIALADGTVALVLDEVNGGSLTQLLGSRGQLTAGETVTTIAPLFGALDDLHAAGVVHGRLAPGSVLFTADGRPMIGDLTVARLTDRQVGSHGTGRLGAGQFDSMGTGGFGAPELIGDAAPSPASDVYSMGALAWFCLVGVPPTPAAKRASLATLLPGTPSRLVDVLTACLAVDPALRPSAGTAAVEVFDAAPAQTVAMASLADPAADITRRIRAGAVSVSDPTPPRSGKVSRQQAAFAIGVVMLAVAVALGIGGTWFLRRAPVKTHPAASPVATHVTTQGRSMAPTPTARSTRPSLTLTRPTKSREDHRGGASSNVSPSATELVTSLRSPQVAAARLQALVDARALAYLARDSVLLDLVYAPGATGADVDKRNIATALKNGGTYLGLSFRVQDVAFLDGRSVTARLKATVVTSAYQSGQPSGREVSHARQVVGPCIFSLGLTPDGWRLVSLTTP